MRCVRLGNLCDAHSCTQSRKRGHRSVLYENQDGVGVYALVFGKYPAKFGRYLRKSAEE